MAAIYLIRHGQASFDKADYDQLSDKGIHQARLLGKYWQSFAKPDKLYLGDLMRHGQTLEHFLFGYHQGGSPVTFPVEKQAGFNEFDHVDILTRYQPKWQDFSRMSAEMAEHQEPSKAFQQAFSRALNRWISAAFNHEYKETWSQFKARCIAALEQVIHQALAQRSQHRATEPPVKDIAIFTSAGPIAVIIQHILALSDQHTLMINQQLRNTSVTKLLYSGDLTRLKLSIDYINNYSHLGFTGDNSATFR